MVAVIASGAKQSRSGRGCDGGTGYFLAKRTHEPYSFVQGVRPLQSLIIDDGGTSFRIFSKCRKSENI